METLVLPAQDQLACHQDDRSKRLLRSSGKQPRSHGNSCASSSQCGAAQTDFPRNSAFSAGRRLYPDASVSGSPPVFEKQSLYVAKALAFRIFHPSSRSQSRGSASLPRQTAGNCLVQESRVSSTGCANASLRSFSVPKGHGWRRSESALRKKSALEAKASSGTQLARWSEGCPGSGRSNFERCSISSEEKHLSKRTGSGSSDVKDDSKAVKITPAVTILQRPKSKEAAASKLASILAGVGESLDVLKTVSSSVNKSVGGVLQDCSLHGKNGSIKSSICGQLDFHSTPGVTRVMPLTNSGSNNCKSPLATTSPDAVMVCSSGRTLENVWRETVACLGPERSGGAQPMPERQGKSLLSGDLKGVFTGSFLITSEVSTREDMSASPSTSLNERWAGPAYSNSPPPSSLPLPTFSIRQLRTTSLEIPPTEVDFCDDASSSGSLSAPATPSRCLHSLSKESSATGGVRGLSLDVVSATKDLRRILNLDV